jgi:hypothetical protein
MDNAGSGNMTSQNTGYYYYPSKYSPPLGHPRLDIYLFGEPTNRFFDAHKAIFHVAELDGFRELTITHPWEDWMGAEVERICAGRFQLIDRNEIPHYGFSLGGDLSIQKQEDYTLCSLTSSAPIFNLMEDDNQSVKDLLVNEFEVLFAQRMATWGTDETAFAKRMSEVEPLSLFLATLVKLEKEIEEMPLEVKEHGYQGITHIVNETIHTIKEAGDWPSNIPSISNLI